MLCPIGKYYCKFIIDRILNKCSIEHHANVYIEEMRCLKD